MKKYNINYYKRHVKGHLEILYLKIIFTLRRKEIEKFLSNKTKKLILDIGCGDGGFLSVFNNHEYEIMGIDHYLPKINQNFKTIRGDFAKYKFNQKFDIITANHVIEHVDDSNKFIRKVSNIIKPGGIFAISTPNRNSFGSRIGKKDWYHADTKFHKHIYTQAELISVLCSNGFVILESHGEFPGFPFDIYRTYLKKGILWIFTLPLFQILKFINPETFVIICKKQYDY